MLNEKLIEAIKKKALELRKAKVFEPQACIWKAMDQCGIRGDDPARSNLYKAVFVELKKDAAEMKEAREAKERLHLYQARQNELSHPEDAYRNDL